MEDEIRARLPSTGRTPVVCRTGNPMDLDDLEIARLQTSRSIVILSPESDDPDADVIKTMLAITNHPDRRPGAVPHRRRDARRREPGGRPAGRRGRGPAGPVRRPHRAHHRPDLPPAGPVDRLHRAARLRRRRDLLREQPELVGRTFGDALLAFEDSTLIGLRPAGGDADAQPADGHASSAAATRSSSSPRTTTRSALDERCAARSMKRRSGPRSRPSARRPSGRWSSAGTGERRRSSASSTATCARARR